MIHFYSSEKFIKHVKCCIRFSIHPEFKSENSFHFEILGYCFYCFKSKMTIMLLMLCLLVLSTLLNVQSLPFIGNYIVPLNYLETSLHQQIIEIEIVSEDISVEILPDESLEIYELNPDQLETEKLDELPTKQEMETPFLNGINYDESEVTKEPQRKQNYEKPEESARKEVKMDLYVSGYLDISLFMLVCVFSYVVSIF